MRFRRLKIDGLYGTLSINIRFREHLNLLVGINGSGKTSALNVIEWLYKKDMAALAKVQFNLLSLDFVHNQKNYTVYATRSESEIDLHLTSQDGSLFRPLNVTLPPQRPVSREEEEAIRFQLRPEEHERPIWEFMESLPKLTVISLDRSISTESENKYYYENRLVIQHEGVSSPVRHVQKIMADRYATYRAQAIQNDGDLKARIVMNALKIPVEGDAGAVTPLTQRQVTQMEATVVEFLKGSTSEPNLSDSVRSFFDYISDISDTLSKRGERTVEVNQLLVSQYRRVSDLAAAFNKFLTSNDKAFQALSKSITCQ